MIPAIILGTIVAILLFVGLIGTLVPGLPGIALVLGGILFYAWQTDFTVVGIGTVLTLTVVAALAVLADYFGSALGAKYAGGKKWALIGTVVGAFIGFFVGVVGMFVGAFVGALVGALIEGNNEQRAMKIALYSMVGIVGSALVQFLLAGVMIVAFVVALFV